ncbi:MAG: hypothetical protein PHV56_05800 [Clostridia bacterium]|nr:hypothetical protein [Clostridia bacterium]
MKVVKIEYSTQLSQITDITDDNIDVFVQLDDGKTYTVVVSTPKNFYDYMKRENIDYYCGIPDIIVKELTHDNIERAIIKYAEDNAYWLKYYYLAGVIDIDVLDRVVEEVELKNKEIFNS